MLKLYHHGSSACAAKVRFALEEKGLKWEGIYIDILNGEQFSTDYLIINPKAVVPTLVHDGHKITESTVICEYLEDAFPEPALYPSTPLERVHAHYWTKAVDEELHPACSAITYVVSHRHTILRNGLGSFDDFLQAGGNEGKEARTKKWQWIQDGLEAPGAGEKIQLYMSYLDKMEKALSDSDWLVGNKFGIADIAMAPYVNRLAALAMQEIWQDGSLPNVADWFDRLQKRPAFNVAIRKWVPDDLRDEMYQNGVKSWPAVKEIIGRSSPALSTSA